MLKLPTAIPDVIHLRPVLYADSRGDFMEMYQQEQYAKLGISIDFVQDNLVHSKKNVFRGMHFQLPPYEQAKLITVISGEILDFVLDMRSNSDTFLKQVCITLSAAENDQLYIPAGFAHGYYVLSENSCVSYKVSKPYAPEYQAGIRWDDEQLGLAKYISSPILSDNDKKLPSLNEILSKYTL